MFQLLEACIAALGEVLHHRYKPRQRSGARAAHTSGNL
jgi:hypothetical protein